MSVLTKKEFLKRKKDEIIVVYGCGYSINALTKKEKQVLGYFDSIGFNWFCKSSIPTTFYLVREQANIPKRVRLGETVEDFIGLMSHQSYDDTCNIVHDISHHSPDAVRYHEKEMLERFRQDSIVVKDIKLDNNASGISKWQETDIIDQGVFHGKCTLNNVMHIIDFLGYEKVVFVGVDLYDSRYFWLDKNETRGSVGQKGKTYKDEHSIAKITLNLIREIKQKTDLQMYTYNKKSLLAKEIPIWIYR